MALVEIKNLRKSFGSLEVLKDVSLVVEKGDIVALIGRSGSGKSTLLRCINGLEETQGGSIRVGDQAVSANMRGLREYRQRVGIVFQQFNLFPHMNVLKNITLAPILTGKVSKADARALAEKCLEKVGLLDKIEAWPEQLSGGQQQRVAIARCLAMSPELMLFDEVTSALDPELVEEVLKVMEDMARQGMTMVLVTHEMGFARNVANKVVFMHQGKIWEEGPPEQLFADPQTSELQAFIRRSRN